MCLSLALWNGRDPILKERLFGLTNARGQSRRGRQGGVFLPRCDALALLPEDALQVSAGAHSPMRTSWRRTRAATPSMPEYELATPAFSPSNRYFDVFVEYAKAEPGDVLMQITAWNRGPDAAPLHLMPQLVLRNTWSWNPGARQAGSCAPSARGAIGIEPDALGVKLSVCARAPRSSCSRKTSRTRRSSGTSGSRGYFKDGFHERIVDARLERVNPERTGTKAGVWYQSLVQPGAKVEHRLRLTRRQLAAPFADFARASGGAAHGGRRVLPRAAGGHRLGGCSARSSARHLPA